MFEITVFLLLLVYACDVEAACKVCQPGSHVCHAPDKYQFCTGSTSVGEIQTCPAGLFCSSSSPCQKLGMGQLPECKCGYCNKDATDNFACISKTQKAKCTGSNTVTTQYSDCGAGQYCGTDNIGSVIKCRNNPNNGGTYKYACEDEPLPCVSVGRFPVANSGCKKYYICELIDGALIKSDFECLGTTFFNPASLQCSSSYIC